MTLNEKAAYLKGLCEGLTFDKNSAEGKLLVALVDLCSDIADEIDRIDEDIEYVSDYCEELDRDLGDVEEVLLDEDEDDDFDDDDFDDDDFDEDDFYEIECPHCGEIIEFDASIDPEKLVCPACHKEISLELEEDGADE